MTNTIIIQTKKVYGNDLIYPINNQAKLLIELTGRKTFNRKDLEIVKGLGFEVIDITDPESAASLSVRIELMKL